MAEFLSGEMTEVIVSTQQSARLRSLGGQEVQDEMRVMLRDARGTTAWFSFSTQIKPGLNQFRVYGPAGSITVDLTSGSVLRHVGKSYKSYLTFLVPPLNAAREHLANAGRNALAILRWRLHQDSGMKELIERFHRSITDQGPPPIAYREIVLTARIMDAMFAAQRRDEAPPVAVTADAGA
jgi:predicted dehydrogenase